jgi:hypothetical protein
MNKLFVIVAVSLCAGNLTLWAFMTGRWWAPAVPVVLPFLIGVFIYGPVVEESDARPIFSAIVLVAAVMVTATAVMQITGRFRQSGMPYTIVAALVLWAMWFYPGR